MLPPIDFTQQLAQIQSQLNTFGNLQQTPVPPVTDPKTCPSKLPCGICTRTNLMCAMEGKDE